MNSKTPFADPLWLTRGLSPYYTDSHRRLQEDVRKYVDTHVTPFCEEWESKGVVPQEVRPVLNIYLHRRSQAGYRSVSDYDLSTRLKNDMLS